MRSCGRAGRHGSRPTRRARGGLPRNGSSRSSGGQKGIPSARYTPCSSGAVGQRLQRRHVRLGAGRPQSSVPNCSGSATTSSTGTPSTVTPIARRSDRSTTETICGSDSKRSSAGPGSPRAHDREHLVRVAPAPRVAGDLSAERLGDAAAQSERLVEEHAPARTRPIRLRQRGQQLRLGLRPDSRDALQPPGGSCLAELVHRPHSERAPDLGRPLRPEAEQPPEPDQLRRDLALQLVELCDPPRLDQLLQPRLDPRADPAQLAHAPRPDEIGDRRLRLADHLGRAPVRPRRVGVRPREVEERRERLEPVRDLRVRGAVPGGHGQ